MHRSWWIGIALALGSSLGVVTSCSSGGSPTGSGAGVSDAGPQSTLITAAAGGVVTDPSGNTTLTIPPGALAQDTNITLSILAKERTALVELSKFGPDGLTFLLPATLSIKGDASLAPTGMTLVIGLDTGTDFLAVSGSSFANGAATAPITHFSSYSIIAVPASTGGGARSPELRAAHQATPLAVGRE